MLPKLHYYRHYTYCLLKCGHTAAADFLFIHNKAGGSQSMHSMVQKGRILSGRRKISYTYLTEEKKEGSEHGM